MNIKCKWCRSEYEDSGVPDYSYCCNNKFCMKLNRKEFLDSLKKDCKINT